jgi:hypothetical protein
MGTKDALIEDLECKLLYQGQVEGLLGNYASYLVRIHEEHLMRIKSPSMGAKRQIGSRSIDVHLCAISTQSVAERYVNCCPCLEVSLLHIIK